MRTQSGPARTIEAIGSVTKSTPQRGPSCDQRAFHDHETCTLKVLDKSLGDNLGHDLIGIVDAFPTLKAQCERKRVGQVGGIRQSESVAVVCHNARITER